MISKKHFDFAGSGRIAMALISVLLLSIIFISAGTANAATPYIGGFSWPENSIQTTNGRVFITSNGGVFELTKNNGVWTKSAVPCPTCLYRGITEMNSYVYMVCRDNNSNVRLFTLHKYSSPGTALMEISNSSLSLVIEPNGMTTDGAGNLYIADMGNPTLIVPGYIIKVRIDETKIPRQITSVASIHSFQNCKPNGMKYRDGYLYLTAVPYGYIGLNQLLRYTVQDNSLSDRLALFSTSYFLDDFILVNGGYVLAEFQAGRLVHINESGDVLNKKTLYMPTSMVLLTSPQEDYGTLVVTDLYNTLDNYGRVFFYANDWNLTPR